MKRILLLSILIISGLTYATAQCSQCTPINCAAQKPAGGLCNSMPDDTAGQPYDATISFYMPHTLTDANTLAQCGCSSVTLRKITVVGIQGLPTGITYTISQGGVYDVAAGDTLGCVHFCGTPVAPGVYYVIVNLLADVTANGIPVLGSVDANGQIQQYRDTIEIFPGVSECPNTFALGSGGVCITKACDSLSVDLDATLTNTNCPSLISYTWDYGNGGTGNTKTPGVINYNTPDTFPITLTTTYYTYRIKTVTVHVTGGYTGDVEELFGSFDPEPYIRVDALNFNNTGGSSGRDKTFSNLDLVIPGGDCANQVAIQVWDEDTGPPQHTNPAGSQDDLINTHLITPSVPNQVHSGMNNSSIDVTFDTVAYTSVNETIDIIVFPHPPLPVIVVAADSICNGDSTTLSLGSLPGYSINWYLNDTTELTTSDSTIFVKAAGVYTAKITNVETGCSEFSAPVNVAVGVAPPSTVNILFNGTSLFVTPFPATGFSVDWFYNGNLVAGQHGKFLGYLGGGLYEAEVYNTNFPACRTTVNPNTITGINDITDNSVYGINVYPNPNNGRFNLRFTSEKNNDVTIGVRNLVGQLVYEKKLNGFTGDFNEELNLSDLGKGVYIVNVETPTTKQNTKVVVQ